MYVDETGTNGGLAGFCVNVSPYQHLYEIEC
jgi:hypothetical protein